MKKIFVLILMVSVFSCTKDKGKAPLPPQPPATPVVPTSTTTPTTQPTGDTCITNIRYGTHIGPIVARSCSLPTCHVSSGYKDFSTYELLKGQVTALGKPYFISRIKPGGGMPPSHSTGPKLTSCEIQKLETWINEGANNN